MILDSFCNRCFLISSDFVFYKIKFAQNNNEAGFLIVCLSVCPIPVNMKCSNTLVQVTTSVMWDYISLINITLLSLAAALVTSACFTFLLHLHFFYISFKNVIFEQWPNCLVVFSDRQKKGRGCNECCFLYRSTFRLSVVELRSHF